MTSTQRLAIVRAHLLAWLQSNGQEPAETGVSESILIAGGLFAGRTFRTGDIRADWFMESDQLKIREAGGQVLAVFVGDEIGANEEPNVIPLRKPDQGEPPMREAA